MVFVDPLDWRHMMLMPALLTAGLLEVGSIAKRMLTFGHEMAEKAVIEKELMVGRDVQARMLLISASRAITGSGAQFIIPPKLWRVTGLIFERLNSRMVESYWLCVSRT